MFGIRDFGDMFLFLTTHRLSMDVREGDGRRDGDARHEGAREVRRDGDSAIDGICPISERVDRRARLGWHASARKTIKPPTCGVRACREISRGRETLCVVSVLRRQAGWATCRTDRSS